jgi:hypothetical protein
MRYEFIKYNLNICDWNPVADRAQLISCRLSTQRTSVQSRDRSCVNCRSQSGTKKFIQINSTQRLNTRNDTSDH